LIVGFWLDITWVLSCSVWLFVFASCGLGGLKKRANCLGKKEEENTQEFLGFFVWKLECGLD